MARTVDYYARMVLKEDGVERAVPEAKVSGSPITRFAQSVIALNSASGNVNYPFGANFNTATRLFLQETAGRSFTYSVNTTNDRHVIAANGFAALHGHSITALYLRNNSTNTTKPVIEVFIAG